LIQTENSDAYCEGMSKIIFGIGENMPVRLVIFCQTIFLQ